MATAHLLETYQRKRDFKRTPEPAKGGRRATTLRFVVQKHAASHLHYDFRLELDGVLKSWAVPKGPSLDPTVKRMAVQVEDHPLAYASFEGTIPPGQYGAGEVIVWDEGMWLPAGDPAAGLLAGKLKFELKGHKLGGHWTLVRMHGKGQERQPPWLLIKERDVQARKAADYDVLQALPDSVSSGRPLAIRQPQRTAAAKRASSSLALPAGAVKAALPATLAPQLATLTSQLPPDGSAWAYEIKLDGYRLLTHITARSVRCLTRNGHDWSAKMPGLVSALQAAGLGDCWLDGELVAPDAQGVPDFSALQLAFDSSIRAGPGAADLVYYVFDLPFYAGHDLRAVSLLERRQLLRAVLARADSDRIRFNESFAGAASDLLDSARRLGLEGLIGKRLDSGYRSGRSTDWIKLKTGQRQEFVIGGYTSPKGSRSGLGALLLGFHDAQGHLLYAGNVGTGFNEATLHALQHRLAALASAQAPFHALPASVKAHWVKPRLVAEVSFAQWTAAGRVRHAVFRGLREDKPARSITRELAASMAPAAQPPAKKSGAARRVSLRVTHPERVIDPTTGVSKGALVQFYSEVAALMLPHLRGRPVSLVRAPSGIEGTLFFQKHAEASAVPGIRLLDPALDPGHAPLLEIANVSALLAASQVNVIEFHTWNATARAIGKPDRMTFDLDPGEGVAWHKVQEAASLVQAFLTELGLNSFLKTSGGKGLHVVVPLRRGHDWATVKGFSQAVVTHLARVIPDRFVAKSGPRNRVGKIFVDYLRNGFGATTVSAWSARARPGLGVSVPVSWDELPDLRSGAHWGVLNITQRLAIGNTPWAGYDAARRGLSGAMRMLGFKPHPPV